MIIQKPILQQAFDSLLMEAIFYRTGELLAKAFDNLIGNDSVEFENGVLTFVSKQSGKKRSVTKFGCHVSCDCLGKPSYHAEAFRLVARYNEILTAQSEVESKTCPECDTEMRKTHIGNGLRRETAWVCPANEKELSRDENNHIVRNKNSKHEYLRVWRENELTVAQPKPPKPVSRRPEDLSYLPPTVHRPAERVGRIRIN